MKEHLAVLGVLACLGVATIVLYLTASVLSKKIKDGCDTLHKQSMALVFTHYPRRSELAFPSDFDELQAVVGQLKKLKEEHFYHVLLLFSLAYLYKQTFAIPGSVFMVSCQEPACTLEISQLTTPTSTEHRVRGSVRVEVGITSGVPADSHRSFDVLSSVVLLW